MTSNTHPDMHGSEPDEHEPWCPAACKFAGYIDDCPDHPDGHECTCDEPPDEDWSDDD